MLTLPCTQQYYATIIRIPMVYTHITKETHELIAYLITQEGLTSLQIARKLDVSLSTIRRATSNLYYFGSTKYPTSKRGRKPTLSVFQEEWICDLMNNKPTYLLREVVQEFWDEWGIRVTEKIVSTALKKQGYQRAAVRRDAA